MTNLKNTYGLKAIPSEKIFKEFRPARGMRFSGLIDLAPEDLKVLAYAQMNRFYDGKAWLGTRLVPEVTPVFRLIADKMGYDLPSLLEGKGETGKPDDSWTVYADEGKTPMLIRWTIGEAQLLLGLAVGPRHYRGPDLSVMLLADRKALGHLGAIGEALRQLEEETRPPQATDVPDGNVLKRVLEEGDSGSDFSVRCVMLADPTQPLSEARQADLAELRNSAQILIEEIGEARGFAHHLKVGEMVVRNTKTRGPGMFYKADERISREYLTILRDWSVEDIEQDMEAAFAGHFEERRHLEDGTSPDAMRQEETPTIDLELAERRARLELVTRDLTEKSPDMRGSARLIGMVQDAFLGRMPTIGAQFKHCPESVLRGTGANLKMSGGDVMRSDDLLNRLLLSLCAIPDQYPANHKSFRKVKLSGVVEAPIIAEGYRDGAAVRSKYTEITNPFYASHYGLPVRVDKSVAVWREGYDEEALAADFFYAPASRDLHIANLYRIKVPKG